MGITLSHGSQESHLKHCWWLIELFRCLVGVTVAVKFMVIERVVESMG